MRDISSDLRERLAANSARYADEMARFDEASSKLREEHRAILDALERERAAVEQLLAIEMERSDEPMSVHNERIKAHRMQLSDFMITIVYASGPLTKDEIRSAT
ncbi:MAG: hypothetical protein ACLP8A_07635, partial [Methylovirgula sp.]